MTRNWSWILLVAAAVAVLMASWLPSSVGYAAGCGGNGAVMRGPNGTFGISESQYDDNMICSWKILIEINKRVQLHFLNFDLEEGSNCRYDNVRIYDGCDRSAPLLHTFCGSRIPGDIRSSGNTMFVYFQTDDGGTSSGFSIYYSVARPLDGCNGKEAVLRGTSGTFGIHKSRYEEDMACSWKIEVEIEKIVQLHFLSFDLYYDFLTIYDGNDTSAPELRTLRGHRYGERSRPGDVTSSGNTIFVYIKTSYNERGRGFNICYSAIVPVDGCLGSQAEMRGDMGTFGIGDGQNTRYMNCTWKIQVDSSKVVQLHFLKFDLGASSNCSSASVVVWDNHVRFQQCGRDIPADYTSRRNTVYVYFKIYNVTTYEGFQVYYSGLTRVEGCLGYPAVLRKDKGTFGIGHDENLTYTNITCRWKIVVTPPKVIELHFVNFDLGSSSNCSSASVQIYDGSNSSAPLLNTLCGQSLPGNIRSSGNTVFVYFKIYNVTKYEGFKSYYSRLIPVEGCLGSPAEMKGDTGTFGTADKQIFTYIIMTCRWKIRVQPTKIVQLHFLKFDLGASSNCSSASVKVYDGSDMSAPLLHTFCGSSLPDDIRSSGSTVFVHLNIGNVTYNYFKIYFSGLIPVEGCLGSPAEMTGDNGTVGIGDGQNSKYMTCMWKIRVEPSKLVRLYFLNFILGSRIDYHNYDSYRYEPRIRNRQRDTYKTCVKIYDGDNTSAPVLNTFCGQSFPDKVTSSGNTVFVVFKINNVNTYEGFKIYYSALNQVEGCVGSSVELRGSKGLFGITDDQYYREMRCSWKIQVEHSKRVKLHFLSLDPKADIYSSFDNIKIYDGSDTSAPLLHTICGHTLPDNVASSSNTISVYFTAIRSDSRSNFRVHYSAFMSVEGCAHTPIEMKGSSGTFGVNKYQYRNDMRCRWNFQVDQSKRVRLHFLLFEVENCTKCLCDSLDFASVEETRTPVTNSLCGSTVPDDINTDTNRLSVYFRTDGSTIRSGFRIYYSDKLPVQGCLGSPVTKHGPKGTFGVDTTHYDNYMACGWKIQVQVFKRVHLHFLRFELEMSIGCTFDNVRVYDGSDTSAPLLHTFCGCSLPDDIRSSSNTIFVQFKTDDSGIYGGFSVYYSAFTTVDGCLGTPVELRGPSGKFGISDGQDHNDMRCSWKIKVDPSKRVRLQFLSFQLGESTGCRKESVTIYDGEDATAALIHTFCGSTVPGDITSSANTVFVHFFSSDNTSTYSGFQIYYSDLAAPGGCQDKIATLKGTRGSFGVTQLQYSNYMRCSWNIQADSNETVKLEFVEFSVESCCDSVTVYDGSSRAAPLLGTFYGSALPSDVISTNSTISVYFESDGSGTWNGFSINYTALPLARADCQPGEMFDGQKCAKCPSGTYQPDRGKTACIDCPLDHTTRHVGSSNVADCQ